MTGQRKRVREIPAYSGFLLQKQVFLRILVILINSKFELKKQHSTDTH